MSKQGKLELCQGIFFQLKLIFFKKNIKSKDHEIYVVHNDVLVVQELNYLDMVSES